VVLVGVLDASNGLSFKVNQNTVVVKTSSNLPTQSFYPTFVDTEKTYSGLADGCAKAGRAGCKLIEITGDNASGNDVKVLLDFAHDVGSFLPRLDNPFHIFLVGDSGAIPRGSPRSRCTRVFQG
jgi:hypothetical protein